MTSLHLSHRRVHCFPAHRSQQSGIQQLFPASAPVLRHKPTGRAPEHPIEKSSPMPRRTLPAPAPSTKANAAASPRRRALRKSYILEPVPGALLNVGDCLEKLGRRGDAWDAFFRKEMLAVRGNDTQRAEYARGPRVELEASGPARLWQHSAPVASFHLARASQTGHGMAFRMRPLLWLALLSRDPY